MGAQGLRCLTRYPPVLPGLAFAKTRTHHKYGTGCWGKEMNKTELKEEERETKGKQKRNGERQGRDKREMEGQRGSKAAGTDLKAEAFRKEWQKERPPDTALSFGCPFPVLPR